MEIVYERDILNLRIRNKLRYGIRYVKKILSLWNIVYIILDKVVIKKRYMIRKDYFLIIK